MLLGDRLALIDAELDDRDAEYAASEDRAGDYTPANETRLTDPQPAQRTAGAAPADGVSPPGPEAGRLGGAGRPRPFFDNDSGPASAHTPRGHDQAA